MTVVARRAGLREQLAVAVEVGGAAGEPLVDGLEPAEPPGRVGVVGGGGTEGEALGVQRALEHRRDSGRRSAVRSSEMTAPMSRRPASTPWSCAWSATSTVTVVAPSSSRVMSSPPSQADQWSSRWPSTRIAYVVGAVFMERSSCWTQCEAAPARGAADGPLGDGQVDHPAGALGEIAGEHAGAEDRLAEALGEDLGAGAQADRVGPHHPRPVRSRCRGDGRRRRRARGRRPARTRRPGGARRAAPRCRASPRRTASARAPRSPPAARPRPPPGRHDGARPGAGGGTVARTAGSRRARTSPRRRCAPRAASGKPANRWSAGMTAGPPASWISRSVPAVSGIALSTTSATGTGQLRSRALIGSPAPRPTPSPARRRSRPAGAGRATARRRGRSARRRWAPRTGG